MSEGARSMEDIAARVVERERGRRQSDDGAGDEPERQLEIDAAPEPPPEDAPEDDDAEPVPEDDAEEPDEPEPDAEPEPDDDPEAADAEPPPEPPKRARAAAGSRTTPRRTGGRRGAAKRTPPVKQRPPTPQAEVGIPADPDPRAPFPAQQTADDPPVRVYTASDVVPPGEADPAMRDGVTYGEVELTEEGRAYADHAGKRAPANLYDICQHYDIGPGDASCFIRVERKQPQTYQGVPVKGLLGHIRHPMTEAEFRDLVGSGVYELVVYGPNPSGKRSPFSSAVETKALTKPITVTHPGNRPYFVEDIETERQRRAGGSRMQGWDPMEGRRRPAGQPPTTADAAIHRDSLQFAGRQLERTDQELKEERRRAEQVSSGALDAVRQASESQVGLVERISLTAQQTLQRQLDERNTELAQLREQVRELIKSAETRPSADHAALSAMADFGKAIATSRGSDEGGVQRAYENYTTQLGQLREAHSRELEAERRRADEMRRDHADAMQRVRDAHAQRERDLADVHDRRERDLKEDAERRERAVAERYQAQIEQMRTDHQRALDDLKHREEQVRETQKAAWEMKIEGLQQRLEDARAEAERARADAENKEDIEAQIEKISGAAEALGFRRGGDENPPTTWQERMAASAGQMFENLPELFNGITRTFQARAQAAQAQVHAVRTMQQAQRVPPQAQRPLPGQPAPGRVPHRAGQPPRRQFWASEEGVPFDPGPGRPAEQEHLRPDQKPPPVGGAPAPDGPPAGPPVPPQGAAPPPGPPPQAAPPPPAAVVPQGEPIELPPQAVRMLQQLFESGFGDEVHPEEFAAELLRQMPAAQLQYVIGAYTPEAVLGILSEDPEGADSDLLSRDGRAWFGAVWATIAAKVQGGG